MNLLGLKVSHDGAFAALFGSNLRCVEAEKIGNAQRYSCLESLDGAFEFIESECGSVDALDAIVVDGWNSDQVLLAKLGGSPLELQHESYLESSSSDSLLSRIASRLRIHDREVPLFSYKHVAGHLFAALMSYPLPLPESVHVMVWDGGVPPLLYQIDSRSHQIIKRRQLHGLLGNGFATIAQFFGPFRQDPPDPFRLDLAGKVMAYCALGKPQDEVEAIVGEMFDEQFGTGELIFERSREPFRIVDFGSRLRTRLERFDDRDCLASIQSFLGKALVRGLRQELGPRTGLLCLSGGCALNIKWNRRVRDAGLADTVWVPPFANDSGSAVGAIATHLFVERAATRIPWSPYCGPAFVHNSPLPGWEATSCEPKRLGELLATDIGPCLVLDGCAEIGPRALGKRSILMTPNSSSQQLLNEIKCRESYRPIAPVCLEDWSTSVFSPGGSEPYMLFEHTVRPSWQSRVPGIVHVDGSARLQTVNASQNPVLTKILIGHLRKSGIPLLCNTSANLRGCGFFPDLQSAMRWGRVGHIWTNNILYTNSCSESKGLTDALCFAPGHDQMSLSCVGLERREQPYA